MVAPVTMTSDKLRREIAFEAARLMYSRQESEYYTAKMKAGRKLCRGWVKPRDLPSNAEIRDASQSFARLHQGGGPSVPRIFGKCASPPCGSCGCCSGSARG